MAPKLPKVDVLAVPTPVDAPNENGLLVAAAGALGAAAVVEAPNEKVEVGAGWVVVVVPPRGLVAPVEPIPKRPVVAVPVVPEPKSPPPPVAAAAGCC